MCVGTLCVRAHTCVYVHARTRASGPGAGACGGAGSRFWGEGAGAMHVKAFGAGEGVPAHGGIPGRAGGGCQGRVPCGARVSLSDPVLPKGWLGILALPHAAASPTSAPSPSGATGEWTPPGTPPHPHPKAPHWLLHHASVSPSFPHLPLPMGIPVACPEGFSLAWGGLGDAGEGVSLTGHPLHASPAALTRMRTATFTSWPSPAAVWTSRWGRRRRRSTQWSSTRPRWSCCTSPACVPLAWA